MTSLFNSGHVFRYILAPIAAASVVQTNICDIRAVKGRSMSPTLSPDYHETGARDFVLIDKVTHWYGKNDHLRRGQIVAFYTPHFPERMSIKRIIGVEGDMIFRDMRRVGSEQRMLESRGYTDATKLGLKTQEPIVKVPKMGVWVEGDYWKESLDSNDLGPISGGLVMGRAVAVVWPPSRWRWLDKERNEDTRGDVSRSHAREGTVFLPPVFAD